jgi:FAD/FMN-containing dehydrogenase
VLASGDIVQANATHHPDLFRALKGGANNFGIVTTFTLATIRQGPILAGTISSPFSARAAVFAAFAHLAGAPRYDPYAELVTAAAYVPGSGWQALTHLAAYTASDAPLDPPPAALAPLLNVPNTTDTLHRTRIGAWANETENPLVRRAFATGAYGVSAALMARMVAAWTPLLDDAAGATAGFESVGFAFEPLPAVFTRYGARNGGNSLGTRPEDGDAMVLLVSTSWNGTAYDAAMDELTRNLIAAADAAAGEMGLLRGFRYLNYAAPWQEPLKSYGEANLANLRAVSKRYDPHGVFQHQVPGGFKLWQ